MGGAPLVWAAAHMPPGAGRGPMSLGPTSGQTLWLGHEAGGWPEELCATETGSRWLGGGRELGGGAGGTGWSPDRPRGGPAWFPHSATHGGPGGSLRVLEQREAGLKGDTGFLKGFKSLKFILTNYHNLSSDHLGNQVCSESRGVHESLHCAAGPACRCPPVPPSLTMDWCPGILSAVGFIAHAAECPVFQVQPPRVPVGPFLISHHYPCRLPGVSEVGVAIM